VMYALARSGVREGTRFQFRLKIGRLCDCLPGLKPCFLRLCCVGLKAHASTVRRFAATRDAGEGDEHFAPHEDVVANKDLVTQLGARTGVSALHKVKFGVS
jgi:hypothetical protein